MVFIRDSVFVIKISCCPVGMKLVPFLHNMSFIRKTASNHTPLSVYISTILIV